MLLEVTSTTGYPLSLKINETLYCKQKKYSLASGFDGEIKRTRNFDDSKYPTIKTYKSYRILF